MKANHLLVSDVVSVKVILGCHVKGNLMVNTKLGQSDG